MNVETIVPGERHCFTIDGLFSADRCAAWIEYAEDLGFGEAPIRTAFGEVRATHIRSNDRAMVDAPERAAELFEQLRPALPQVFEWRGSAGALASLNERLRFYRYRAGQRFAMHRDGHYLRPDESEISRLSLLLYLNDEFEGGETRFFDRRGGAIGDAKPRAGRVLVFPHPILHAGRTVTSGVKYVLRTDVMYALA